MYELNKQAFGAFLAQSRKEKGYTQKDVAQRLYVSDKAVSKWERGLSVPDVSLLVPLAELLGVSVTELLEGRRLDAAPLAPSEVESIVQKAIAYPEERETLAERMHRRGQKHLLPFVLCAAIGVISALSVWRLGLAADEGILALLLTSELLGLAFGAYTLFFIDETLPRYYDENRINTVSMYGFRISIPGVCFNNNNWKRVLGALQLWALLTTAAMPALCALTVWLSARLGVAPLWKPLLLAYLAALLVPLVWTARKYELVPQEQD